jgi:hypothetical protein
MVARRMLSASTMRTAMFSLLASLIALGAFAANSDGRHEDTDVVVTAVSGDVSATMAGAPAELRVDSKVALPTRIVTGSDGAVGLAQAQTAITIAADTDIEIPAEAAEGQLIARIVQHRGNVFYDVAHREVGRLRVETPFLVAVIKGTQFNVAVQGDSTTISLFEGRLEILTPDLDETIQLDAGEIAVRSRIDGSIRVIGMDENRVPPPPRAAAAAATDAAVARSSSTPAETATVVARVATVADDAAQKSDASTDRTESSASVGQLEEQAIATSAKPDFVAKNDSAPAVANVAALPAAQPDLATLTVTLDARSVDTGPTVRPEPVSLDPVEAVTVDTDATAVGTDIAIKPGTLETGNDLGATTIAVALDTRGDIAPGIGQADLDLGSPAVDVDAPALDTGSPAVDLLESTASLELDADLDLAGNATLDIDVDTGLSLDTTTPVDLGLDTGADLGTVDTTVSVDLGTDVGLDVDLDESLDLDLGLVSGGELSPLPAPAPGGSLGGAVGRLL